MALTIEMPPQMAEEARGYAVLEGMSLEALLLKALRDELMRYRERKAKSAVAVQHMDGISPRVQSLCGIVSLPPDFDDKNIRAEAALEKYESISRFRPAPMLLSREMPLALRVPKFASCHPASF